jgi:hypothetical protein
MSENKYEIVSGLDVPKSKRKPPTGGGRSTNFPFGALEVGDAFFSPTTDKRPVKNIMAGFSASARRWKKTTGNEAIKFAVRVHEESGRVGCWRVE